MLVPRSLFYVVGRAEPMLRIDAALGGQAAADLQCLQLAATKGGLGLLVLFLRPLVKGILICQVCGVCCCFIDLYIFPVDSPGRSGVGKGDAG